MAVVALQPSHLCALDRPASYPRSLGSAPAYTPPLLALAALTAPHSAISPSTPDSPSDSCAGRETVWGCCGSGAPLCEGRALFAREGHCDVGAVDGSVDVWWSRSCCCLVALILCSRATLELIAATIRSLAIRSLRRARQSSSTGAGWRGDTACTTAASGTPAPVGAMQATARSWFANLPGCWHPLPRHVAPGSIATSSLQA